MTVSFWQILTALAPILAPVISLVLVLIGRIVWNHEQRLRSLEQSETRYGRSLYGDEGDAQQSGITESFDDLRKRLERLEQKVDQLNGHYEDD